MLIEHYDLPLESTQRTVEDVDAGLVSVDASS